MWKFNGGHAHFDPPPRSVNKRRFVGGGSSSWMNARGSHRRSCSECMVCTQLEETCLTQNINRYDCRWPGKPHHTTCSIQYQSRRCLFIDVIPTLRLILVSRKGILAVTFFSRGMQGGYCMKGQPAIQPASQPCDVFKADVRTSTLNQYILPSSR